MSVSHHALARRALSLINYLVWPTVDILVFDMASCSLKASFSKNLCP
jgi:hypothetical protein